MADLVKTTTDSNVGISVPVLDGSFIPAIDNRKLPNGLGLVVPYGGGTAIRPYTGEYGISTAAQTDASWLQSQIDALAAQSGNVTNFYLEGLIGPPGPPGPQGPQGVGLINLISTPGSIITNTLIVPYFDKDNFSSNDPDAGKVSWTSDTLQYGTTSYTITANAAGTTNTYIYWDLNSTPTSFHTTNTIGDAIGTDKFLMCHNDSGTATASTQYLILLAGLVQAAVIRAENYVDIPSVYAENFDDSLDTSYPFECFFKINSATSNIVSIKLSFLLKAYRAYSTTVPSGGASTSGAGGGTTKTSGAENDTFWETNTDGPSTGNTGADTGNTGSTNLGTHYHQMGTHYHTVSGVTDSEDGTGEHTHDLSSYNVDTNSVDPGDTYTANLGYHFHDMDNHVHSMQSHTHGQNLQSHTHNVTLDNHTHSTPAHTHALSFGIYEESNSPTVHFHIDNGGGYGGASANYTTNQTDLNVTASFSGTGWKAIRFDQTAGTRCRIVARVELRLDITA